MPGLILAQQALKGHIGLKQRFVPMRFSGLAFRVPRALPQLSYFALQGYKNKGLLL